MWVVIFLYLGPIIYFFVSIIVDSISDNINEYKRKHYYKEEEIINISTYNNNNITPNDIMHLFISQLKMHRSQYFVINYKIYNDKNEQNYSWSVKTKKQIYGCGIIYNIQFHFSNGWFSLSFSDDEFISGGKSSQKYYLCGYNFGTDDIEKTLDICKEESRIKWKMNGREPKENFPFNYIPLTDKVSSSNNTSYGTSSNNNKKNNNKEEKSSYENTTKSDLLSFYRNLLGLKLSFTLDELKKSYHEAVRKYHPDRYSASSQRDRANAEMLMKQVNEAYEKLKVLAG